MGPTRGVDVDCTGRYRGRVMVARPEPRPGSQVDGRDCAPNHTGRLGAVMATGMPSRHQKETHERQLSRRIIDTNCMQIGKLRLIGLGDTGRAPRQTITTGG